VAKPKVTAAFRSQFSEKLMDLGNIVFAGLVIGQVVSGKEFSVVIFGTGIILMISCYFISYVVSVKKEVFTWNR